MSEFTEIYDALDEEKKKEVEDFALFLYQKQHVNDEEVFNWQKFKEKLLKGSVWEKESIQAIENAGKNLKLRVEEW